MIPVFVLFFSFFLKASADVRQKRKKKEMEVFKTDSVEELPAPQNSGVAWSSTTSSFRFSDATFADGDGSSRGKTVHPSHGSSTNSIEVFPKRHEAKNPEARETEEEEDNAFMPPLLGTRFAFHFSSAATPISLGHTSGRATPCHTTRARGEAEEQKEAEHPEATSVLQETWVTEEEVQARARGGVSCSSILPATVITHEEAQTWRMKHGDRGTGKRKRGTCRRGRGGLNGGSVKTVITSCRTEEEPHHHVDPSCGTRLGPGPSCSRDMPMEEGIDPPQKLSSHNEKKEENVDAAVCEAHVRREEELSTPPYHSPLPLFLTVHPSCSPPTESAFFSAVEDETMRGSAKSMETGHHPAMQCRLTREHPCALAETTPSSCGSLSFRTAFSGSMSMATCTLSEQGQEGPRPSQSVQENMEDVCRTSSFCRNLSYGDRAALTSPFGIPIIPNTVVPESIGSSELYSCAEWTREEEEDRAKERQEDMVITTPRNEEDHVGNERDTRASSSCLGDDIPLSPPSLACDVCPSGGREKEDGKGVETMGATREVGGEASPSAALVGMSCHTAEQRGTEDWDTQDRPLRTYGKLINHERRRTGIFRGEKEEEQPNHHTATPSPLLAPSLTEEDSSSLFLSSFSLSPEWKSIASTGTCSPTRWGGVEGPPIAPRECQRKEMEEACDGEAHPSTTTRYTAPPATSFMSSSASMISAMEWHSPRDSPSLSSFPCVTLLGDQKGSRWMARRQTLCYPASSSSPPDVETDKSGAALHESEHTKEEAPKMATPSPAPHALPLSEVALSPSCKESVDVAPVVFPNPPHLHSSPERAKEMEEEEDPGSSLFQSLSLASGLLGYTTVTAPAAPVWSSSAAMGRGGDAMIVIPKLGNMESIGGATRSVSVSSASSSAASPFPWSSSLYSGSSAERRRKQIKRAGEKKTTSRETASSGGPARSTVSTSCSSIFYAVSPLSTPGISPRFPLYSPGRFSLPFSLCSVSPRTPGRGGILDDGDGRSGKEEEEWELRSPSTITIITTTTAEERGMEEEREGRGTEETTGGRCSAVLCSSSSPLVYDRVPSSRASSPTTPVPLSFPSRCRSSPRWGTPVGPTNVGGGGVGSRGSSRSGSEGRGGAEVREGAGTDTMSIALPISITTAYENMLLVHQEYRKSRKMSSQTAKKDEDDAGDGKDGSVSSPTPRPPRGLLFPASSAREPTRMRMIIGSRNSWDPLHPAEDGSGGREAGVGTALPPFRTCGRPPLLPSSVTRASREVSLSSRITGQGVGEGKRERGIDDGCGFLEEEEDEEVGSLRRASKEVEAIAKGATWRRKSHALETSPSSSRASISRPAMAVPLPASLPASSERWPTRPSAEEHHTSTTTTTMMIAARREKTSVQAVAPPYARRTSLKEEEEGSDCHLPAAALPSPPATQNGAPPAEFYIVSFKDPQEYDKWLAMHKDSYYFFQEVHHHHHHHHHNVFFHQVEEEGAVHQEGEAGPSVIQVKRSTRKKKQKEADEKEDGRRSGGKEEAKKKGKRKVKMECHRPCRRGRDTEVVVPPRRIVTRQGRGREPEEEDTSPPSASPLAQPSHRDPTTIRMAAGTGKTGATSSSPMAHMKEEPSTAVSLKDAAARQTSNEEGCASSFPSLPAIVAVPRSHHPHRIIVKKKVNKGGGKGATVVTPTTTEPSASFATSPGMAVVAFSPHRKKKKKGRPSTEGEGNLMEKEEKRKGKLEEEERPCTTAKGLGEDKGILKGKKKKGKVGKKKGKAEGGAKEEERLPSRLGQCASPMKETPPPARTLVSISLATPVNSTSNSLLHEDFPVVLEGKKKNAPAGPVPGDMEATPTEENMDNPSRKRDPSRRPKGHEEDAVPVFSHSTAVPVTTTSSPPTRGAPKKSRDGYPALRYSEKDNDDDDDDVDNDVDNDVDLFSPPGNDSSRVQSGTTKGIEKGTALLLDSNEDAREGVVPYAATLPTGLDDPRVRPSSFSTPSLPPFSYSILRSTSSVASERRSSSSCGSGNGLPVDPIPEEDLGVLCSSHDGATHHHHHTTAATSPYPREGPAARQGLMNHTADRPNAKSKRERCQGDGDCRAAGRHADGKRDATGKAEGKRGMERSGTCRAWPLPLKEGKGKPAEGQGAHRTGLRPREAREGNTPSPSYPRHSSSTSCTPRSSSSGSSCASCLLSHLSRLPDSMESSVLFSSLSFVERGSSAYSSASSCSSSASCRGASWSLMDAVVEDSLPGGRDVPFRRPPQGGSRVSPSPMVIQPASLSSSRSSSSWTSSSYSFVSSYGEEETISQLHSFNLGSFDEEVHCRRLPLTKKSLEDTVDADDPQRGGDEPHRSTTRLATVSPTALPPHRFGLDPHDEPTAVKHPSSVGEEDSDVDVISCSPLTSSALPSPAEGVSKPLFLRSPSHAISSSSSVSSSPTLHTTSGGTRKKTRSRPLAVMEWMREPYPPPSSGSDRVRIPPPPPLSHAGGSSQASAEEMDEPFSQKRLPGRAETSSLSTFPFSSSRLLSPRQWSRTGRRAHREQEEVEEQPSPSSSRGVPAPFLDLEAKFAALAREHQALQQRSGRGSQRTTTVEADGPHAVQKNRMEEDTSGSRSVSRAGRSGRRLSHRLPPLGTWGPAPASPRTLFSKAFEEEDWEEPRDGSAPPERKERRHLLDTLEETHARSDDGKEGLGPKRKSETMVFVPPSAAEVAVEIHSLSPQGDDDPISIAPSSQCNTTLSGYPLPSVSSHEEKEEEAIPDVPTPLYEHLTMPVIYSEMEENSKKEEDREEDDSKGEEQGEREKEQEQDLVHDEGRHTTSFSPSPVRPLSLVVFHEEEDGRGSSSILMGRPTEETMTSSFSFRSPEGEEKEETETKKRKERTLGGQAWREPLILASSTSMSIPGKSQTREVKKKRRSILRPTTTAACKATSKGTAAPPRPPRRASSRRRGDGVSNNDKEERGSVTSPGSISLSSFSSPSILSFSKSASRLSPCSATFATCNAEDLAPHPEGERRQSYAGETGNTRDAARVSSTVAEGCSKAGGHRITTAKLLLPPCEVSDGIPPREGPGPHASPASSLLSVSQITCSSTRVKGGWKDDSFPTVLEVPKKDWKRLPCSSSSTLLSSTVSFPVRGTRTPPSGGGGGSPGCSSLSPPLSCRRSSSLKETPNPITSPSSLMPSLGSFTVVPNVTATTDKTKRGKEKGGERKKGQA